MHLRPLPVAGVFCTALILSLCLAATSAARPPLDNGRAVEITLTLPLRNQAELEQLVRLQSDPASPEYHHFLTRTQFRARYGPDAATVARVGAALAAHGLTIVRATTQSIRARGTARAVSAAFTARLAVAGATLTGLETRPRKVFDFRRAQPTQNRYSAGGPYWFDDLKQAYAYPAYAAATGKGATIGIVISSDISDADLALYFGHERFSAISGAPTPAIARRPVLGGAPFEPASDASAEASLDVQQSLGSAPGARVILYDIPSQFDDAILAGYTDVVEDDLADVVSSSFGACEKLYTEAYNGGIDETGILRAEHALFLQGNAQGQTFVAASGDNAGLGCPSLSYFLTGKGVYEPGIQDPASDPNVTAVGGTNLITSVPPSPAPNAKPDLNARYVSENALGDKIEPEDLYNLGNGAQTTGGVFGSGSGASVIWPKPWYQRTVDTGASTRAIPDVSMHMGGCPVIAIPPCHAGDSAVVIVLGGNLYEVIGTSAAAPEFAGLVALRVAAFGERLGNLNPSIYGLAGANHALPYPFFHTRIAGDNGVVTVSNAARTYNPIVGVGTPYAKDFIGLPGVAGAGSPQTPSNP